MTVNARSATSNHARRVLIASLIGSTVEWYEFFIYGTAASLLFNDLFFPEFDPLVSSLLALSTFAIAFAARPIGGVVFGHFGDRVGRKSMLVITLTMMGVATFAIGLLPTYAQIGAGAPLLLVLLRLIQGFSLGGEYGGAVLMSVEHAGAGKRGLFGAVVNTGAGWGLLLANLVFLVVSQLPEESFRSWGWRGPFLLSAVLVALGLWSLPARLFENHDYINCVNGGSKALQQARGANPDDTQSGTEEFCANEFGEPVMNSRLAAKLQQGWPSQISFERMCMKPTPS